MATKDDESTPRSPMTKCEVLAWFFGKSRFDARPDRCAECPANGGSSCPTRDELVDAEDNAWQIWEVCDS